MIQRKTLYVGKAPSGKLNYKVFLRAEVNTEKGTFSISGVHGPLANGNCMGGCGQITSTVEKVVKYAPNWNKESVDKLLHMWDKWHLNDMKAGCIHQRELGWSSYDEHPSEPCPVCGYKYGSSWLKEDLTPEFHDWFNALPESEITPAWV